MARSVRELHEEVYDSGTHLDENCSLIDEDYWYENDLVLAAELGKTLLERNKELESQLVQSQRENNDQQFEIELLTKQLSTLRELSQSKMRIYEDVDKQCQELEKTNKALMSETKADRQRIQSLSDHIVTLENRHEELREQLDRSRREERARERQGRRERSLRKATSVPSVAELREGARQSSQRRKAPDQGEQAGADIDEVVQLHDKICELSFQVTSERRKRESLETETRLQIQENEDLRSVISSLRSELLALRTAAEHNEASRLCPACLGKAPPFPNGVLELEIGEEVEIEEIAPPGKAAEAPPDRPRQDAVAKDLFSAVEHDTVAVREGEIGRLRTGGKVFSSRESLNRVGAEGGAEKSGDISLLAELDQQYNKLVLQYENLIASKHGEAAPNATSTAAAAGTEGADVTNGSGVLSMAGGDAATGAADPSSEAANTAAHFEKKLNAIFSEETRKKRKTMITPNYRPQYKQLFREAFSVLKEMQGKDKAKGRSNDEVRT